MASRSHSCFNDKGTGFAADDDYDDRYDRYADYDDRYVDDNDRYAGYDDKYVDDDDRYADYDDRYVDDDRYADYDDRYVDDDRCADFDDRYADYDNRYVDNRYADDRYADYETYYGDRYADYDDRYDYNDYDTDYDDRYADYDDYDADYDDRYHDDRYGDDDNSYADNDSDNDDWCTNSDDSKTDITVSYWNIMGRAKEEYRKKVAAATFQRRFHASTGEETSLGEADIICVQEMKFDPEDRVASEYLPFLDSHAIGASLKEPGRSRKRTGIFYKKGRLVKCEIWPVLDNPIERAFKLMEYKKKAYDDIAEGGDERILLAVTGKPIKPKNAAWWGDSAEKIKKYKEVLEECRTVGSLQGFRIWRSKFIGPQSSNTESPRKLLENRIGICCLRVVDFGCKPIVVVSVHSYKTQLNFGLLFFDFVNQLEVPALITGYFHVGQSLTEFLCGIEFNCIKYVSTRAKCIYFILAKGACGIKTVKKHDLQMDEIPETVFETSIANHHPWNTTIHMRINKKHFKV
jgi:hypothetical protein